MKKIVSIAILGALLLLMTSPMAFAADALYRMLHADQVESLKKDQDAMIVGQLIGKNGDLFTVKVLKVLSGRVAGDRVAVQEGFTYGWSFRELVPAVNDFAVMSLKQTGGFYKRAWGVFKADSGDYRTLNLIQENAATSGLNGDLAAIQWYVNSGGKESDFYFNSGTVYVRRPNGESLKIYPDSSNSIEMNIGNNELKTDKLNNENGSFYPLAGVKYLSSPLELTFGFLGVINFFGFLLMGYDKFKAKKRGWRVPEKSFFLISLVGGATGVVLGMKVFRHKTKHYSFNIGIPLLIGLNAVIIYYIVFFLGQ